MGVKNQPMFPNGVIYEGVSEEPTFYRGVSGANDSTVPTLDNLLQLTNLMPQNEMTEILSDFRSYRPVHHTAWLQEVKRRADDGQLLDYVKRCPKTTVLYMQMLDAVREFRMRHWSLTREYVLKASKNAVGTGGSPIVHWLPNQLRVVINLMQQLSASVDRSMLEKDMLQLLEQMDVRTAAQQRVLQREVEELTRLTAAGGSNSSSK